MAVQDETQAPAQAEQEGGEDQMAAYTEAVKSGLYAKRTGLVGKYDNVRRYWEDDITRQFLAPHLEKLVEHCRQRMQRLRIVDIGCGSADGWELLAGVRLRDASLQDPEALLLTSDVVGQYTGIELNEDLLQQAAEIYGANPKMVFRQGDMTQSLFEDDEEPYDLYFTSFGTCSHHNEDETFVSMLAEIVEHTEEYALVVCDWLGRYSYEWQTLWTHDHAEHRNMDYVVSYIYTEEEREARRDEMQHLLLRLMSREEAEANIAAAAEKAGAPVNVLRMFDRSVFTGRHMDTADYNPHAQPMRAVVNSLHEVNVRTDLTSLLFDYAPKPGFEFLNRYYENLQMAWNTLVQYAIDLLALYDEERQNFTATPPAPPAGAPPVLRKMMDRMHHVIESAGWLDTGLPRENIIEPQLGYSLRQLVGQMQQGIGGGHGLVAILEIDKRT